MLVGRYILIYHYDTYYNTICGNTMRVEKYLTLSKSKANKIYTSKVAEYHFIQASTMADTKRARKKGGRLWGTYIRKVVKEQEGKLRISGDAVDQLDRSIGIIARSIISNAGTAADAVKRVTIQDRDIGVGVSLTFDETLASYANGTAYNVVSRYMNMSYFALSRTRLPRKNPYTKSVSLLGPQKKGKNEYRKGGMSKQATRTSRANIIFSIPLAEHFIRAHISGKHRVSEKSAVYLAAALQYVAEQMIESATEAIVEGMKTITTRALLLGVDNDEELRALFNKLNIQLAGAGVVPNIESALVPTEKDKKAYKSRQQKKKRTMKIYEEGTRTEKLKEYRRLDKEMDRARVNDQEALKNIKAHVQEKQEKIPRKKIPGIAALDNIRKQQKSTKLIIARAPFKLFVKALSTAINDDKPLRHSKNSTDAIQHFIENYLIEIFETANLLAINANRITISANDIQLVQKICKRIEGSTIGYRSDGSMGRAFNRAVIIRLSQRAGVRRRSSLIYEEVRDIVVSILVTVMRSIIAFTKNRNAGTVNIEDVRAGLQSLGANYTI